MKNYIIIFLIVVIILISSFLFRRNQEYQNRSIFCEFPFKSLKLKKDSSFVLLFYFSKNNCIDCLRVTEQLNKLRDRMNIVGVVPVEELENEIGFRNETGVKFSLIGVNGKLKRLIPNYSPSLIGINKKGSILFVIPSLPGDQFFIYEFLIKFYEGIVLQ